MAPSRWTRTHEHMLQPRLIPAARFGALIVLLAVLRPDSVAAYALAAIALCLVLVPDAALARRAPRWPHALDGADRDDFAHGYSLLRSGRSAEAEPWLRRALEAHAADADARLNLGIALAELGRHEDAVVELGEAARLRPRDARARYRLGVSSAAVGRHFAAVHALRDAVRLDPRLTAAARALETVSATLSSRGVERASEPAARAS